MDSQVNASLEEKATLNVENENPETAVSTVENVTSQQEVIARLKELAASDDIVEKSELDALKHAFYKIYKNDISAARLEFIEKGGTAEDFLPAPNVLEEDFKAAMNLIKQKRAERQALIERQKEENVQKKLEILERI
ncbi:MAG: DUF349 domain-containing protein, partial [Paraprevotella sp.]|nr:DUF349 domain-containing protein [Paraprevotella sp.]